MFQALLRAEARELDAALGFLAAARSAGEQLQAEASDEASVPVRLYDPVPMPLMRMAGKERAQLLLESASRRALHAFIGTWMPTISALRTPVRWQLDVDPLEI